VPFARDGTDHVERKPALARQDLRGAGARAENAGEIGLAAAHVLNGKPDQVDRIRRPYRPTLGLIVANEHAQHFEAVRVRRTGLRLAVEIALVLGERPGVVGVVADRANLLVHHTVSGLIRSYSLCVPTSLRSDKRCLTRCVRQACSIAPSFF